jgi:predicted RNA-binding protein with PIN domain
MAHIIIDGYNVTGIHHGNMEAAREELLGALTEYNASRRHAITVVFDGWKEGPGAQQSRVSGGIRTVFSALGVRADTVIMNMVDGSVQWIVISSDREVQSHAWASGSVPVGAEQFLRILEQGTAGGEGLPEADFEEDDDSPGATRGGNPRRKSRKQKSLDWALAKLRG